MNIFVPAAVEPPVTRGTSSVRHRLDARIVRHRLEGDLLLIGAAFVALTLGAHWLNLFGALARFIHLRNETPVDDIVMALALLPFVLLYVIARRWRQTQTALAERVVADLAQLDAAVRYRDLFDSCSAGISRWGFDGILRIANPAFLTMLGVEITSDFPLPSLMGQPAFTELLLALKRQGKAGPVEMCWNIGDRDFHVRFTATSAQNPTSELFDLHTHDMTSERSLETQLRHAQKMDAVGRLAGGIAHDFNNLLTVIINEAELAKEDLPAESPVRTSLTAVIRAGERATILTRQLLTFSRRDIVSTTVFALGDVVVDMTRMLERLIGEDVQLVTKVEATSGLVEADRSQIEQVILNLVVNARDAMPTGGKLIVEVALRDLDTVYSASHLGVVPGEYVMVAVSDSGVGMTAEVQERLFEPFFTTKPLGHGTGLGLATSFGIVKQANGHIGVYSEPEIGTTMRVYLPRKHAGVTALAPAFAEEDSAAKGVTILLVEDEATVRQVAVRVLERHGYTVIEAANGMEAIKVLEGRPLPVDLIVTDMIMPGIGGRELGERIGQIQPGVKMLFMSGYTDDIVLRHRFMEHNVAFLQKPFTARGLAAAVRAACGDQKQTTSGEVWFPGRRA